MLLLLFGFFVRVRFFCSIFEFLAQQLLVNHAP